MSGILERLKRLKPKKSGLIPIKVNPDSFPEIESLKSLDVEFIFSEWGESRVNAGGAVLSQRNRLEPTLSSLRKFFPNAKFTLYADFDPNIEGVQSIIIDSPIPEPDHPRHGYRTVDYYKFKGLLNSKSELAIVFDSDMIILNDLIYYLLALTQKYGSCAPINARGSVLNDIRKGADAHWFNEGSGAVGVSYNNSPISFLTSHVKSRAYFEQCCQIMVDEPSRCPLVMSKASWRTGYSPYVLPPQFCLCEGYEGIGNEIVLHIGHPSVFEYYKDII